MAQQYPPFPGMGYDEYVEEQQPAMEAAGQQPFGFQQPQPWQQSQPWPQSQQPRQEQQPLLTDSMVVHNVQQQQQGSAPSYYSTYMPQPAAELHHQPQFPVQQEYTQTHVPAADPQWHLPMPPSANISTSSNSGNAIANGAWSYHQTQKHQQQRQQLAPADYQQHQQFPFPIGEFNQNTNNNQQPSRIHQPSMDYQQQHPNAPQIADEVAVGHLNNAHLFENEAVYQQHQLAGHPQFHATNANTNTGTSSNSSSRGAAVNDAIFYQAQSQQQQYPLAQVASKQQQQFPLMMSEFDSIGTISNPNCMLQQQKQLTMDQQHQLDSLQIVDNAAVAGDLELDADAELVLNNAGMNQSLDLYAYKEVKWTFGNPRANCWDATKTEATISENSLKATCGDISHCVFAEQAFDISGDCRMTETILYYFEVQKITPSKCWFDVSLTDGNISADLNCNFKNVYLFTQGDDYCVISKKKRYFKWENGAIKPTWNLRKDDILGCGLLLNPNTKVSIFFTANGILMGGLFQIKNPAKYLFPTICMKKGTLEANFGDDPTKPFKFNMNQMKLALQFKKEQLTTASTSAAAALLDYSVNVQQNNATNNNINVPSLRPAQPPLDMQMEVRPAKRKCPAIEQNMVEIHNLENDELEATDETVAIPAPIKHLTPDIQLDFSIAHALVEQLGKKPCRANNVNECIRNATEAIFDAVLPECWPHLKALIVEANTAGGTGVRAHPQQQPTGCILMKAKLKHGVSPTKNPMDKNDLQRTNMSARIHGISLQNACLLFSIVRHEPTLGVRFGAPNDNEDGSLGKNEHCKALHLQLINRTWVFCCNPDHYETPESRRKKKKIAEERKLIAAAAATSAAVPSVTNAQQNLEETTKQANQQNMEELVREMALLFKKQQMETMKSSQLAKLVIPKGNRWRYATEETTIMPDGLTVTATHTKELTPSTSDWRCQHPQHQCQWQNVYADKGFPVSAEHARKDNFVGALIWYFEVTQTTEDAGNGSICVGLQDECIFKEDMPHTTNIKNTYAITSCDVFIFSGKMHPIQWPNGSIKPEWDGIGDVLGCGILMDSKNGLAIFFTGNGILMGQPLPIKPVTDYLTPTVAMKDISVEANFGEDLAKPFKFDIQKKWRELILEKEIVLVELDDVE